MINKTPDGQLKQYLTGDLGVARRHIHRLLTGDLPYTHSILLEISRSIEDCIKRIERDCLPTKTQSTDDKK